MCEKNQHDFAVLSVSDVKLCKTNPNNPDELVYCNPATLFCRKCGFIFHVDANVHKRFSARGMRAKMAVVDEYAGMLNTEDASKAVNELAKLAAEATGTLI